MKVEDLKNVIALLNRVPLQGIQEAEMAIYLKQQLIAEVQRLDSPSPAEVNDDDIPDDA